MRLIYTPKHQKLVNNCYPTGRTTDKKPKSSETAYLLYYVNSRRSKLEKVSSYLARKSAVDFRKRHVGNISVTLVLLNQIVINCKENLNVFIIDFLSIMTKAISDNIFNTDIAMIDLIQDVFKSICQNADDTLYNGDIGFIQSFKEFTKLYFITVTNTLHNDELLLKGCLNIAYASNLAGSPPLNYLISESVNFGLMKFEERHPKYNVTKLDTSVGHSLSKRLSRSQTRAGGLGDDEDDDLSVKVLKRYFNTTETDKLSLSLRALLKFLMNTPNVDLLEYICDGIPVQLRYIVVVLLVKELSNGHEPNNYIAILKLVSSVLVSDVSIVGLSILDIMRKLLTFQLRNSSDKDIINQTYITISDLNTKIYYREQTSDMLYELLTRIKTESDQTNSTILINNVENLIIKTSQPCIGLDLFLDLSNFIKTDYISLFSIVDNQISSGFLFSNLFEFVSDIASEETQRSMMADIFEKYKNLALLSGLNYFSENTTSSTPVYYMYHMEAARFLNLSDYQTQTRYKMKSNILFSKNDMMNFYSDIGSNKYSNKGALIIMSQGSQLSTSDLSSDHNGRSITTNDSNQLNTTLPFNGSASSAYRSASADSKSLNAYKIKAPQIGDLKIAFGTKDSRNMVIRESGMLGTESLKSRITNITFLLSELKSDTGENEKIRDPDEEDIIGMDRIDLARSTSLKIRPIISYNGNNRNSTIVNDVVVEEDNFKDAEEVFQLHETRGKLFGSV